MSAPRTRARLLNALDDGMPHSVKDLCMEVGLTAGEVSMGLRRAWESGLVLRTKVPLYESETIFKGRRGVKKHTRPYHLFKLVKNGSYGVVVGGREFVPFSKDFLDVRGGGAVSKARMVLEFLKKNRGRAFFSRDVADALKDRGVRNVDIMSAVRRFERRGYLYVRGYKTDSGQTPFAKGYLLTWLDQARPREIAIQEAVERTNKALEERAATNPIIYRIHKVRDIVLETSKLKEIVGYQYIKNELKCSEEEAWGAINRAIQLYPDIQEVRLFNTFRYFYHASMGEEDLHAAVMMKENHIRITKGRQNRIGHNWEACVEWFIDKFTDGARFWTQNHRSGMDPRRITIHLVKSVRGRVSNSEVDRVWSVTPGIFAQPITYVLECKWGLVSKKDVDDFFDILRWSTDFGADTPEGRQLKQGVIGVFAGSSFNPKEHVLMKDGVKVGLAKYAARLNIQILKASDFNTKLHERGAAKEVTVQKICRLSRDEGEVRELMESVWEHPERAESTLGAVGERNRDVYDFERMLAEKPEELKAAPPAPR